MTIYNYTKAVPEIGAVSAECGTGKTFSTCQHIKQHLNQSNHMYVAPTLQLLKQTQKQLQELGIEPVLISSDSHSNVKHQIIQYLNNCFELGHVLLITWNAYSELPQPNKKDKNREQFPKRHQWQVYIDECPQLDHFYSPAVPFNQEILANHIQLHDSPVNETLGKVVPKSHSDLKKFLDERAWKDDAYKPFAPLLQDVLSTARDVFVDLKSWNQIMDRGKVSKIETENRVYFVSMLNWRLLRNTTVLAANLEQSMLMDWMTRYHDCEIEQENKIIDGLRAVSPKGEMLRISYFLQGKAWSKAMRDKTLPDGIHTIMNAIEKGIMKEFGDDRALLVVNNDYKGMLLDQPNLKRIEVDTKGMNQYQDYTKIVFIPALNREPKHLNMLNQLGIDNETIRQSSSYEMLYQAVMRTALRDPENQQVVDVIVPSEYETKFLITIFGEGVSKKRIGDLEYKKYKPLTGTQKNHRSKIHTVTKQLLDPEEMSRNHDYLCLLKKKSNDLETFLEEDNAPQPQGCYVTFHKKPNQVKSSDFKPEWLSHIDFKDLMKDFSKTIVEAKDELLMLNPSVYDPKTDDQYRTYDNLVATSMLVLDFDNGDLSIQEFEDIFWNKAGRGQKRSFIICNSFRRSEAQPNRFRVFMPFKQPVFTVYHYWATHDAVLNRLEQHRHTKNSMKLDIGSRSPNQSYWVPCTNREHPDWAYFKAFGFKSRDLERCSLDPDQYLKTMLIEPERTRVAPMDGTKSQVDLEQRIQAIKDEYLAVPSGQGRRNNAFFVAGLKLSRLMSFGEAETVLREFAGNQEKFRNRPASVIKQIRKLR